MTVKELIETLSKYPEDAEVKMFKPGDPEVWYDCGEDVPVVEIKYCVNKNYVELDYDRS